MANKIDTLRKNKGLRYADLSKASGLTASYICALAKGRRKNPSAKAMQKIAGALGENTARVFPL